MSITAQRVARSPSRTKGFSKLFLDDNARPLALTLEWLESLELRLWYCFYLDLEEDHADVSLTERLRHFIGGDKNVAEMVLREVLPKLRRIAARQVGRERNGSPLTATELIHEFWLRNLHHGSWQIRDRDHFYAIAAFAMRQTLIDFARKRSALMRGGGERTLGFAELPDGDPSAKDHEQIVLFGIAMQQLERKDLLTARVVDLHYFAGFSLDETAAITGLSPRQVRHRWGKAQSFLRSCLPRSG